jgi:hypothetical protein
MKLEIIKHPSIFLATYYNLLHKSCNFGTILLIFFSMLGDLKTPKTLIFCHLKKTLIWKKNRQKKIIKIKHRHTQK